MMQAIALYDLEEEVAGREKRYRYALIPPGVYEKDRPEVRIIEVEMTRNGVTETMTGALIQRRLRDEDLERLRKRCLSDYLGERMPTKTGTLDVDSWRDGWEPLSDQP